MAHVLVVPKKFKIFNRTWHVKVLTKALERQFIAELNKDNPNADPREELNGLCDAAETTIYLKRQKSRELLEHTYLHELGHAIFDALGWDMPIAEEEVKVEALAQLLHQWIQSRTGVF